MHAPFDIIIGRDHPNAVSILPGVVRPNSRGWVRLASADPLAAPLINPNYLSDHSDLDRLVQATQIAREIFATRAFRAELAGELTPGPQVRTEAELVEYVKATADSYHHQAACAAWGPTTWRWSIRCCAYAALTGCGS